MAMYYIHQEPLAANKINGRICINLEECKEKENSVLCTALAGKWSIWLDCSKTIHRARFRHTELIRETEQGRREN